ncbi:hypothetical protein QR680_003331 [Steinernema hermaphroditum]|uniref:MAM domain-containing protein n=1 Tax=Steinernema hermaphroditum TaxID=289476 RepID=A0AA39LK44_9BILA|nr:hypothetical protein QR680_003331 [Steinernema hermaphroditum]
MRQAALTFIAIVLLQLSSVDACFPHYKKELRYLSFYLGVRPVEKGEISTNDEAFTRYIRSPTELNCNFTDECAWKNVDSDGLLDSSDFYLFEKYDKKTFPIQVRPGNPNPVAGSHLVLAGNTTALAQSAVLISAPIACQKPNGQLSFEYWLYNNAKVEVVLVKRHSHRRTLQVVTRPPVNCHFLRSQNAQCVVDIPEMTEPFQIGIRAFNLRDPSVGGFMMLSNIRYVAEICKHSMMPYLFGGTPLASVREMDDPSSATDFSCSENFEKCKWFNGAKTPASGWRIGRNLTKWETMITSKVKPSGNFLYQFVDAMARRPYAVLESAYVPCTTTATSISFKYWLMRGSQAQICTVSLENVPLSCAYLSDSDAPGPITVDVDSEVNEPFKFTVELIEFDHSRGGLIVIDDIVYSGLLCTETTTQAPTTIDPYQVSEIFRLQPFPDQTVNVQARKLDCSFEEDFCTQWINDDGKLEFGLVPGKDVFDLPFELDETVGVIVFDRADSAQIKSRPIPCSYGGAISIAYFTSGASTVDICAKGHCNGNIAPYGFLDLNVTSYEPFEIEINAASKDKGIVIIKDIQTNGKFCELQTPSEMACKAVSCNFKQGNLCRYTSPTYDSSDIAYSVNKDSSLTAVISFGSRRAVLLSPEFEVSEPVQLLLTISHNTFGSLFYFCGDNNVDHLDRCQLLLGPKVENNREHTVTVEIETDTKQFSLVAYHDKFLQFGEATFTISDIRVQHVNGTQVC